MAVGTLNTPPTGAPAETPTEEGNETETPEPKTPENKTFSQDEVNKLLAANKKTLQKKLAGETEARTALEKRLAEIEARVSTPEIRPEDKTSEGRLEAALKKVEKDFAAQAQKMAEVEARAVRAEAKRVEALKDRALDEALQAAGCSDLSMARPYYLTRLVDKDDDEEPLVDAGGNPTWAIRLPSGNLADLTTGIAETLPKYLRNSNGNVGGAGTVPGKSKQKNQIEELEKKVNALAERARATGRDNDVGAYTIAKKQLQALKSQK